MVPRTGRGSAELQPILHRAARIEDAFHRFREGRARKRGLNPVVIPYTGYGSSGWARVLCRVLLSRASKQDDDDAAPYRNIRGWRSFTSVPVNNAVVTVTVGGREFELTSDRGGVVDERIDIDLAVGWNDISFTTEGSAPVKSRIYIVDSATRFGVVSDIDDTVMVTALPRPLLAAWNTFVLNEHARTAVPGMSVLYERLVREHPGSPVIYLSTGAWNVAPTLGRFLSRNLYPAGPLLLTDWGPTSDRLFRSGRQHKRESLDRLAEEFPTIEWLLIGDDGQHDEELYGAFSRRHEHSVRAVCIRQLSTGEAVFAGGRSSDDAQARATAAPWLYSPDGAGLSTQLTDIGVLPSFPR